MPRLRKRKWAMFSWQDAGPSSFSQLEIGAREVRGINSKVCPGIPLFQRKVRPRTFLTALLLKVWPLDQQHQHHLEAYWERRISGPPGSDLLGQNS